MRVYKDINMQAYNTFNIAAQAAVFIVLDQLTDIEDALTQFGNPNYILWWGSNVVISKDIHDVVWHPLFTERKIKALGDKIYLTCGSWCIWHEIVQFTVQQGWRGIENLIAIPWHIWAAPVQNIGAYWVELKDAFASLEAYDFTTKEMVTLHKDDCHFGYRHSIFKEQPWRYMICNVTLELSHNATPHLEYAPLKKLADEGSMNSQQEIATTIEQIRRSKLPKPEDFWNCWSFFQNPIVDHNITQHLLEKYPDMPHYPQVDGREKLSAARLIEQSGCKWLREGNIWTYSRQPLVLINYGWGTGTEALAFAQHIIDMVYARFSISLEREVNIW